MINLFWKFLHIVNAPKHILWKPPYFKSNVSYAVSSSFWIYWKMAVVTLYRDLSNALFPFYSGVKARLQIIFYMRHKLVFFYCPFIHLRSPLDWNSKLRTIVQRKSYFHLNNSGNNSSCPVRPLARAFAHTSPSWTHAFAGYKNLCWVKVTLSS